MKTKSVDQLMKERRSSRGFNLHSEVSHQDLKIIIEAMRFSPSAYGLLNYRVLVFPRSPLRRQLNPLFYNQKNFQTASHFLLLVAEKGTKIYQETIFKTTEAVFHGSDQTSDREHYITNFKNVYQNLFGDKPELANAWSAAQTYIALGAALVAAADVGVDSCPMEGFNREQLTTLLIHHKLITEDEFPVVGLALGENIDPPRNGKVRKTWPDFVQVIK